MTPVDPHAREHELERRVENLERALTSRSRIARAQGVVMERYGITEEGAVALLCRVSNQSNTKVRVIADRILAGVDVEDL